MPYVKRDEDQQISSITQTMDADHCEFVSATSEELITFLTKQNTNDLSKEALAESDRDIARVTEDLVYLLISKNIILFTDLPVAVQEKLLGREKLRSNLKGVMDNFLDEDELI